MKRFFVLFLFMLLLISLGTVVRAEETVINSDDYGYTVKLEHNVISDTTNQCGVISAGNRLVMTYWGVEVKWDFNFQAETSAFYIKEETNNETGSELKLSLLASPLRFYPSETTFAPELPEEFSELYTDSLVMMMSITEDLESELPNFFNEDEVDFLTNELGFLVKGKYLIVSIKKDGETVPFENQDDIDEMVLTQQYEYVYF